MSESTGSLSSTRPEIKPVYDQPIELLDESIHQDNITLTKKINEILKKKKL